MKILENKRFCNFITLFELVTQKYLFLLQYDRFKMIILKMTFYCSLYTQHLLSFLFFKLFWPFFHKYGSHRGSCIKEIIKWTYFSRPNSNVKPFFQNWNYLKKLNLNLETVFQNQLKVSKPNWNFKTKLKFPIQSKISNVN